MLQGNDRAVVPQADVRHPHRILNNPRSQRLIDFDQPLALLLTGILLFVPDEDDPHGLVAHYLHVIASGSHLVIVHGGSDAQTAAGSRAHRPLSTVRNTHLASHSRPNNRVLQRHGTGRTRFGFHPFWRPDSPVDSNVHTWVHSYGPDPVRRASLQDPDAECTS